MMQAKIPTKAHQKPKPHKACSTVLKKTYMTNRHTKASMSYGINLYISKALVIYTYIYIYTHTHPRGAFGAFTTAFAGAGAARCVGTAGAGAGAGASPSGLAQHQKEEMQRSEFVI